MMARDIQVSSDVRETAAYIQAHSEGWIVPTLQTGIGETIAEIRKTSHFGIGLPPIASKVNE